MSPRKKTFRFMKGKARARALLPWLACVAVGLSGCNDPPVDSNTPDPAGVMEGTVLYVGPRPACEYENGVPVRAKGRVILTLFVFDNQPPPDGTATSALNLLAIPGNELFGNLAQSCPAEGVVPDPDESITSSADFTWPELPLGTSRPVGYAVKGFYDHDESFNPFFNILQTPTAGDIAGGAVDNPQAVSPQLVPIVFGTQAEHPFGQIVGGVSVSLGLEVNTEPPIFYATSDHLPSETALRLSVGGLTPGTEEMVLALTNTTLHLYPTFADAPGQELAEALAAAGLEYDIGSDNPKYAWYVRGVDVDGEAGVDPHPVLFHEEYANFRYLFPIVLLKRRMTELEVASGIPAVVMATAVPQNATSESGGYADGDVVFPDIRIGVPPVAIAITNPALGNVCRIPFFAPGTISNAYYDDLGAPRVADCQELPTGRYDYNALNGIVNGEIVDPAPNSVGFDITGGRYSSQTWTAPNALGEPAQFVDGDADPQSIPASCSESPCAIEQSVANAFLIYDDTPETYHARRDPNDAGCLTTLNGANVSEPIPASSWNEDNINTFVASNPDDEFDDFSQVQAACCDPIAHLCDLPLCGTVEDPNAPGHSIRATPTSLTGIDWNGERRERPNCVPFHMPTPCCPEAPPLP